MVIAQFVYPSSLSSILPILNPRALDETDYGKILDLYIRMGSCHATYDGDVHGWTTVAHLKDPAPTPNLGRSSEELQWNYLTYTVPPGEEGLYHIVTNHSIDLDARGMFGTLRFEIHDR